MCYSDVYWYTCDHLNQVIVPCIDQDSGHAPIETLPTIMGTTCLFCSLNPQNTMAQEFKDNQLTSCQLETILDAERLAPGFMELMARFFARGGHKHFNQPYHDVLGVRDDPEIWKLELNVRKRKKEFGSGVLPLPEHLRKKIAEIVGDDFDVALDDLAADPVDLTFLNRNGFPNYIPEMGEMANGFVGEGGPGPGELGFINLPMGWPALPRGSGIEVQDLFSSGPMEQRNQAVSVPGDSAWQYPMPQDTPFVSTPGSNDQKSPSRVMPQEFSSVSMPEGGAFQYPMPQDIPSLSVPGSNANQPHSMATPQNTPFVSAPESNVHQSSPMAMLQRPPPVFTSPSNAQQSSSTFIEQGAPSVPSSQAQQGHSVPASTTQPATPTKSRRRQPSSKPKASNAAPPKRARARNQPASKKGAAAAAAAAAVAAKNSAQHVLDTIDLTSDGKPPCVAAAFADLKRNSAFASPTGSAKRQKITPPKTGRAQSAASPTPASKRPGIKGNNANVFSQNAAAALGTQTTSTPSSMPQMTFNSNGVASQSTAAPAYTQPVSTPTSMPQMTFNSNGVTSQSPAAPAYTQPTSTPTPMLQNLIFDENNVFSQNPAAVFCTQSNSTPALMTQNRTLNGSGVSSQTPVTQAYTQPTSTPTLTTQNAAFNGNGISSQTPAAPTSMTFDTKRFNTSKKPKPKAKKPAPAKDKGKGGSSSKPVRVITDMTAMKEQAVIDESAHGPVPSTASTQFSDDVGGIIDRCQHIRDAADKRRQKEMREKMEAGNTKRGKGV